MQKLLVVVAAVVGLLSWAEGATIGQMLSGSLVGNLVQAAGLTDTLNSDGPYTFFMPTDRYLQRYLDSEGTTVSALKTDPAALKAILLYHVVSGTIPRDQLYNERTLTSLNGQTIRVNNYADRRLTVQGVVLQPRSVLASNGIIHYLYNPMEASNGTVVDVVKSQSDLSTLLTAVQAADIVELLLDQNPITVFAPTNQAFNALGSKVTSLLENPTLLAEILRYHVIPGTLYTAGVHTADLHTFEEADKLHISTRYGVSFTVDNGHLMRIGDDLSATNGVVHKIDRVLIPESLKGQI